jgi:transposase
LRLLKASAAGLSARQVAARFEVGVSTANRWIARAKEGQPTSRPQSWKRPSALDAHEAFVIELIDERKDVTLDEVVALLSAERQVRISRSAVGAWLRGRGWTFKKVRTCTGARPALGDVARNLAQLNIRLANDGEKKHSFDKSRLRRNSGYRATGAKAVIR